MNLKNEAPTHPAFKYVQNLQYSLDELPEFLNADVPNGDWIFGCDRRIWQTAFYSQFICFNKIYNTKGKGFFCIERVNNWLEDKAMCKTPCSAKKVGIHGRHYPEFVPAAVSYNMPTPWRTLRIYFNHLCELGMLEFSGIDWRRKGNLWFKIIRKTPGRIKCTT